MHNVLSKAIAIGSLALVLFAYLPTIQRPDYVTQDQWRAFRYSLSPQTPFARAVACGTSIPSYYLTTGRPLVWLGECVEHAVVAKVDDYKYVRPFALLIVLATVIYVGSLLGPYLGGLAMGMMAVALFVFVPGYAFMYFQAMTAGMVLIAVMLAAGSFYLFNRGQVLAAGLCFMAACMIYPSWAFLVFAIALFHFGFSGHDKTFVDRLRSLTSGVFFYGFLSVVYYVLVRLIVMKVGDLSESDSHRVALRMDPFFLWSKVQEIIVYVLSGPPLRFLSLPGMGAVIVGIFSMKVGLECAGKDRTHLAKAIVIGMLVFAVSLAVLVMSLSPWLLSQAHGFATRCKIPVDFFFCVTLVGLFWIFACNLPDRIKSFIPLIVLVVILGTSAIKQNQLSSLETDVSRQEIQFLRTEVNKWIDQKGYTQNRYVLIVRPQMERPLFVDDMHMDKFLGENAVLGSAMNPEEIPWMFNAVLRERSDHPLGGEVSVTLCAFDMECPWPSIRKEDAVLGVTNGNFYVKSEEKPYIINLSQLTSRPRYPDVMKYQGSYWTYFSLKHEK